MTIDVDSTLGDLVTAHPDLAREFERRGLDYCCDGRRTIGEACQARDLDVAAVVADLEAVTTDTDDEPWAHLDPGALADHIETVHHRYLWEELPRLSTLADRVVDAHGQRHPEVIRVAEILGELRDDLEPHLLKEEKVLFPMIRQLTEATSVPTFHCGRITNPITMMMLEHDRVGVLLERLHVATGQDEVPAGVCASFRALWAGLAALDADTRLHIHKENNLLFPAVIRMEQRLASTH